MIAVLFSSSFPLHLLSISFNNALGEIPILKSASKIENIKSWLDSYESSGLSKESFNVLILGFLLAFVEKIETFLFLFLR